MEATVAFSAPTPWRARGRPHSASRPKTWNEEELADERSALAGSYRVGLATNSGVARELVTALTADEPIERLDRFPEQLLAVDRDQVMGAIRTHLHPEQLVMTAAGDFEG